jgi:hypothetical protein
MNLTGADTVIFYDSGGSLAVDLQAQGSAHRIGQTKELCIYRLVSESTVEENMLRQMNQNLQHGTMVKHIVPTTISGGMTTEQCSSRNNVRDIVDTISVASTGTAALASGSGMAATTVGAGGKAGRKARGRGGKKQVLVRANDPAVISKTNTGSVDAPLSLRPQPSQQHQESLAADIEAACCKTTYAEAVHLIDQGEQFATHDAAEHGTKLVPRPAEIECKAKRVQAATDCVTLLYNADTLQNSKDTEFLQKMALMRATGSSVDHVKDEHRAVQQYILRFVYEGAFMPVEETVRQSYRATECKDKAQAHEDFQSCEDEEEHAGIKGLLFYQVLAVHEAGRGCRNSTAPGTTTDRTWADATEFLHQQIDYSRHRPMSIVLSLWSPPFISDREDERWAMSILSHPSIQTLPVHDVDWCQTLLLVTGIAILLTVSYPRTRQPTSGRNVVI